MGETGLRFRTRVLELRAADSVLRAAHRQNHLSQCEAGRRPQAAASRRRKQRTEEGCRPARADWVAATGSAEELRSRCARAVSKPRYND